LRLKIAGLSSVPQFHRGNVQLEGTEPVNHHRSLADAGEISKKSA